MFERKKRAMRELERAMALVINRRMKKRGMRWCRPNVTAVVALRTDLLNEDWILPQQLRAFPYPTLGFGQNHGVFQ
jgi:hypothetical protein